MKPGKIIPIIIIVSIAGFILYSLQGSQSSESYLDGIRQYREDKNSQMVGEGAPFAGKAKEFT
ncbi:MAG TPA: hypothetical protein PKW06_01185, partial [Cyclobacteriaceae bacterium]|nr:hypothetical protein [Cyclobacteriaceae bacterium]